MERRSFGKAAGIALAAGLLPGHLYAKGADDVPGFFDVLNQRRSVRAYADKPVSDDAIETMLRCAMLSPSAVNEQPWEFIIIRDRSILEQVGKINRYATFADKAPVAILLCLNENKEKESGMGIIDTAICAENLMLAATALGIGSVFTGIYPIRERMEGFAKLCDLPHYVIPIGLIVLGYPKMDGNREVDRYNAEAVHRNKW